MAIHRNQAGAVALPATEFYNDVIRGLNSNPKHLLSKYFYDAAGDYLFQQIMKLPEYYLTRCEMEIFRQQTKSIAEAITRSHKAFDLIELGAGDASKSVHLLKQLQQDGIDFTYYPVDISKNIIRMLQEHVPLFVPGIKVHGLNGDYIEMVRRCYQVSQRPKVVLFLGSSIGNFNRREASAFLKTLQEELRPGDILLVGFDLKKDPFKILAAYNDAAGITKAFNLNLLTRINNELEADFDINAFEHYPTYDPVTGACRSFLVSKLAQEVHIGDSIVISFAKDEPVYMELSQKYSVEEITQMGNQSGFEKVACFFDSTHSFLDYVWEKM